MNFSTKRRCSNRSRAPVMMFGAAAVLAVSGCGGSKSMGDASSGQTGGQAAGSGTGGGATAGNGNAGGADGDGSGGGGGSAACPAGSGTDLRVAAHPDEGNNHVTVCSAVHYQTVPPSSGSHYPIWPVYKTYGEPVPWGYLMHGLEHGAVVVVYNCPAGCPEEVAAAQAWIDSLPAEDPLCPGEKPRVILAPDLTLDVRWAASAWGWTLRWCAFDPALLQPFFAAHYNKTIEKICRSSGGADQSAIGWCP